MGCRGIGKYVYDVGDSDIVQDFNRQISAQRRSRATMNDRPDRGECG